MVAVSDRPPPNPLVGEVYFDVTSNKMKIFVNHARGWLDMGMAPFPIRVILWLKFKK